MNESSNRNPDTTKGDTPAKAPFTEPKLDSLVKTRFEEVPAL